MCDKSATVGLSTPAIIRALPPHEYRLAVISAGSNDSTASTPLRLVLRHNLGVLRGRVRSAEVIWVLPANRAAASIVNAVAAEYGDKTVTFTPGPDGVHPKSYQALWRNIQRRRDYG